MVKPAIRSVRGIRSDDSLEPHEIDVPANYPIRFNVQNVGSQVHQFMIPAEDYSVDVLPGQTCDVVWTFVNVGRFEIVSRYDDDVRHGLKGELFVETLI